MEGPPEGKGESGQAQEFQPTEALSITVAIPATRADRPEPSHPVPHGASPRVQVAPRFDTGWSLDTGERLGEPTFDDQDHSSPVTSLRIRANALAVALWALFSFIPITDADISR